MDAKYEPDLTPAFITISYDPCLQYITKKAKEEAMVNRGCPFMFILNCFLIDHPEVTKRYPPGVLGFTLNGRPPELSDGLKDGDLICFMVCDNSPFVFQ